MNIAQQTIKKEVSLSGIGLHTGCKVNVTFKPAEENSGIQFVRMDLPHKPAIRAVPENLSRNGGIPRCTSIQSQDAVVHTVEHVMSVLCGLQIHNIRVELDAEELPGLDGSAIDFFKALKKAGIAEQKATVEPYSIKEPLGVHLNGSSLYIFPDNEFRISYLLDYQHPFLASQFFNTVISEKTFEEGIAPCRTFCLEMEADELKSRGLGKGANFDNTLVVGKKGVIKNKVRFPDEFARHKVLDFIGDLYILGYPIKGHVFAIKSGHALNINLLKMICQQKEETENYRLTTNYIPKGNKVIEIDEIMKILPHRYPFLLVDRVIEIEKGKKAVGIKNVTANDNFFQGHFPKRPIMPGVLMVEAMAQTAGVAVLTNEAHHGKVAFFLAADKVKFRKVVVPGDQLVMEAEVLKDKARTAQIRAVARVNDEIVAEADMVFSFTDEKYLQ